MAKSAAVVLNGRIEDPAYYEKKLEGADITLAADGGAELFLRLDTAPDYVIGDFDSLDEVKIDSLKNMGAELIKHPVEKDETDAELCLDFMKEKGVEEAVLLASLGGRIDQELANIFLLEYSFKLGISSVIREKEVEVGLIFNHRIITGEKGSRLSLLPLDSRVKNISISGCKYTAENLDMNRYKTRGLSNKITEHRAEITLDDGILIYIIDSSKTVRGE